MRVIRVGGDARVLQGNVFEWLRRVPSDSVDCVVTSPPYWQLRDYGVAGQLGREPTLAEYLRNMVAVCRELRRVLKPTGTLWLNVGDTYARRGSGLKPKNLCMVPNRLAIALQSDGWIVRSEIVWHKPALMPESVSDRPSVSHEKVWMLSRGAHYFYDAEAVRESAVTDRLPGRRVRETHRCGSGGGGNSGLTRALQRYRDRTAPTTRNARNVWTIAVRPYAGAHFATMPPELAERCVAAGSSEGGCCRECGAPRRRVVRLGAPDTARRAAAGADSRGEYRGRATKDYAAGGAQDPSAVKARILAGMRERETVGWRPTCRCRAGTVPCTVLDPFGGSGTTSAVARAMGRRSVAIELNPEYARMAARRIASVHVRGGAPLFRR